MMRETGAGWMNGMTIGPVVAVAMSPLFAFTPTGTPQFEMISRQIFGH